MVEIEFSYRARIHGGNVWSHTHIHVPSQRVTGTLINADNFECADYRAKERFYIREL